MRNSSIQYFRLGNYFLDIQYEKKAGIPDSAPNMSENYRPRSFPILHLILLSEPELFAYFLYWPVKKICKDFQLNLVHKPLEFCQFSFFLINFLYIYKSKIWNKCALYSKQIRFGSLYTDNILPHHQVIEKKSFNPEFKTFYLMKALLRFGVHIPAIPPFFRRHQLNFTSQAHFSLQVSSYRRYYLLHVL